MKSCFPYSFSYLSKLKYPKGKKNFFLDLMLTSIASELIGFSFNVCNNLWHERNFGF